MAIDKRYTMALSLLLAGCMVGPDFKSPKTETPATWFRTTPENVPGKVTEATPPDPNWWKQLNDQELDKLVKRIASENLDVLTATTRLEQSRAESGVTASGLFPQINGDASFTREKESDKGILSLLSGGGSGSTGGAGSAASQGLPSSQAGPTPPFNIWQYGFDASWEIDLWGRVRRSVEASNAQTAATEEMRRNADLSATAELVSDYVQLRGTQASLVVLHKNLEAARESARLAQERARHGLGNDLDVANAAAQASATEAQLPPLEQKNAELMNAIALLLGQPPGNLEAELKDTHPIPPTPAKVPVGVPSELIQRRPDIREADAQLHAATAEIGIAKADFFPRVTLLGDGALQALKYSDLNSWAARMYSFGPSIALPIFEGGRLVSTLELRKAGEREAAIQYRKTVLTAFHEVDNALTAFRSEQRRHAALARATEEDRKAFMLATERYKKGLSSFLDVLIAERSLLNAELQEVQSAQTETVNMVQLYKALGGGWETDFPEKTNASGK